MPSTQHHLQLTPNRRFLQYSDGTPFFYLGDTAWELFHRLTLAEADRYLSNRAAKGFMMIQAVALAGLDGLTTPNANGDLPLEHPPHFHDPICLPLWTYVQVLGERCRDSGSIWILGGDRNITNAEALAIITNMAAGLSACDDNSHLKTFHPIEPGRSDKLFPMRHSSTSTCARVPMVRITTTTGCLSTPITPSS